MLLSMQMTQFKAATKWLNHNKLLLNIIKTKYMMFGTDHVLNKLHNTKITRNYVENEQVEMFKNLDITLDSKLSGTFSKKRLLFDGEN